LLQHFGDSDANKEVGVGCEDWVEEIGGHCEKEFVAGVEVVEGSTD
jgi:hypothetical protein